MGVIDDRTADMRIVGQGIPVGPATGWAELLADCHARFGMDTFTFAPAGGDQVEQMRRFSEDVVPRAREAGDEVVNG